MRMSPDSVRCKAGRTKLGRLSAEEYARMCEEAKKQAYDKMLERYGKQ